MPVPRELFVISDLHIGGERPSAAASLATKAGSSSAEARGFRINTHVGELAGFLRELVARRRRAGWPIELVINGDIVDFLAERSPRDGHFKAFVSDPAEALEIFTSIVGRNTEFFDALAELPAAGVALTLLLVVDQDTRRGG